jgi:NADPH2 dehydrogenase
MKNYINRFTDLPFNNGLALSNRVVIPPMASETADLDGFVTDKTLTHYARLSEAGAGLVIVEYSYIDKSGRSEPNQLGIYHDDQIEGLKKVSEKINSTGALAGIQLTHSGGKTESAFTDGLLHSPSGVIVPVKDKILERPAEMGLKEINDWKRWFIEATDRAVAANFDLVELHAAHGYGLNQWLSPITNKRSDNYGGSIQKNARLLLEIVQEIRSTHPDLLLSVRMPGQDFIEGGLRIEDSIFLAKQLQEAGANIINISSGIGGWKRPRTRLGEGYLVEEASIIQSMVNVPVIGVGGIESGEYIDELLQNKKISLAAVGRAILKDPITWGNNQLRRDLHV